MSFAFDNTSLHVQVAREASRRASATRDEAIAYRDGHLAEAPEKLVEGWIRPLEAASRDGAVAVVFSGMAIESFVNALGARELSGAYFKNYLDKLDLTAKWVVVPALTGNTPLDRDGQLFERLKRLVRDRNALVHSKYREFDGASAMLDFAERACDYVEQGQNAIAVLDGLAEHFEGPLSDAFRAPDTS